VTLAGALQIKTAGFTPSAGQSYPIITAGSITGAFSQVDGRSFPNRVVLNPVYSTTQVVLTGTLQAPGIVTQPVGQTVTGGQSATIIVAASGPAISYQWQHLVGAAWMEVGTNSPAYTIAAATTSDAGDYRVIVTNSAGSVVSNAVILIVNPKPAPLAPGLEAEFFRFTPRLRAMPNLAGRVADLTRTDAVIDYRPTKLPWPGLDTRFAHTFAVRETGFLDVSTPGRYRLSLFSKDGSRLWLDGALVVDNGGIHGLQQRVRTVTLAAGLHALRVEFFANTGISGLILSWSGPGIAKQAIPANQFSHATAGTGGGGTGTQLVFAR
jgi:hypothetical protein